jgi:hypothetical protein
MYNIRKIQKHDKNRQLLNRDGHTDRIDYPREAQTRWKLDQFTIILLKWNTQENILPINNTQQSIPR